MPFFALICVLTCLSLFFAIYFFYFHPKSQLKKAPQSHQIKVRILNKRVLELELSPEDSDEALLQYWIYVQPLKGGAKREFEVNADNFQALKPGDRGTMSYLGMQFIDFTKI